LMDIDFPMNSYYGILIPINSYTKSYTFKFY